MVEIAKAVARDPVASKVFDRQFISDGGEFESMIEKHGFALTRMEPRLTAGGRAIAEWSKAARAHSLVTIDLSCIGLVHGASADILGAEIDRVADLVFQTEAPLHEVRRTQLAVRHGRDCDWLQTRGRDWMPVRHTRVDLWRIQCSSLGPVSRARAAFRPLFAARCNSTEVRIVMITARRSTVYSPIMSIPLRIW